MSFKEICDKAVEVIESCWDENNPNDGLTFDQRLEKKIKEIDDEELKTVMMRSIQDPL